MIISLVPLTPPLSQIVRDLVCMHEHTFLAPAGQLQDSATKFRAKRVELDARYVLGPGGCTAFRSRSNRKHADPPGSGGRLQTALAQLQHHRNSTYQSKLKASLLLRDYQVKPNQRDTMCG